MLFSAFCPYHAAILAILFGGQFNHSAKAANWFVDSAAGSGLQNGLSWDNAWTSMGAIVWGALSAGDVVWVRGGPYDERVAVGKSGTSPAVRITLKGVGSPVIRGINGAAFDHIAVIGFEITHASSANNFAAIKLANADGWLIQDNHIHDTFGGGVDAAFNTVNSSNIIRHNTFDDIASVGGGVSSAPVINIFGDFNLVEYNTVLKSLDRTRAFGTGNIIRNNYWGATDAALYPNTSPFPHHTDSFQSFNSSRLLTRLLYERNWDEDNKDSVGGTNAHGFLIQDDGSLGFNWTIIRFNVLLRPGGAAYQFRKFTRAYAYNLTSIMINNGSATLFRNAVTYDTPSGGDIQDWRNNTWSFCPKCIDSAGIITTVNRPTNFTSDYQHAFNIGTQGKLPPAPNNLPQIDPLFTNIATDDYTLQAVSPLRGSGGSLTTASGAGASSTSLTVTDARRLFDGWGIADPDTIKIGSGSFVQISSIDYAANVVTLASPRSWSNGDPVIVKGMEDIGALPFSYAKSFTVTNTTADLTAGANMLSATVNNPDAVRMVEFLVDGLPVGIDFTTPYSVSYTSDGNPHTVAVRAYAMWASKTLAVEATGAGPAVAPSNATTSILVQ